MKYNKDIILKIDSKIKELELFKKNKVKHWNISYNLGLELTTILEKNNFKNILEIGTSNGFSTLFIAKSASKDSKITTIEVNSDRFSEAKINFKSLGLENIFQIKGEIFDLIETGKINSKFDFIFLDAAQKSYLNLVKKLEKFNLLEKNFVLVADNIISHEKMKNFIEYMEENYICSILEIDSGFLIAKNKN